MVAALNFLMINLGEFLFIVNVFFSGKPSEKSSDIARLKSPPPITKSKPKKTSEEENLRKDEKPVPKDASTDKSLLGDDSPKPRDEIESKSKNKKASSSLPPTKAKLKEKQEESIINTKSVEDEMQPVSDKTVETVPLNTDVDTNTTKNEDLQERKVKSPPPVVKSKPKKTPSQDMQGNLRKKEVRPIEERSAPSLLHDDIADSPVSEDVLSKPNDDNEAKERKVKSPPPVIKAKPKKESNKGKENDSVNDLQKEENIKTVTEQPVESLPTDNILSESISEDRRESIEKVPPPAKKSKPKKAPSQDEVEKLAIVKELKDCDFIVGSPLKLSVEINTVRPVNVEWLLDGDILEEEDGIKYVSNPPSYCLEVDKMLKVDEGEYTCVVSTEAESVETTCLVLLSESRDAPKFIAPLEPLEVQAGELVEFRALIEGKPTPAYKWYYNEKEIEISDKVDFGADGNEIYLIIENVTLRDQGEYKVEIFNAIGKDTSTARLTVIEEETPPKLSIDEELQKMIISKEGDEIILKAKLERFADKTVTWFKKDKKLASSKNVEILEENDELLLLIKSPTVNDSGVYSVSVETKLGRTEASFEVKIEGRFSVLIL